MKQIVIPVRYPTPLDRTQTRLIILAALFLGTYSTALTLAPAVRARSWQVTYDWGHWLGFILWFVALFLANFQVSRWLPGRDPYLLPVAGLLSGWGILTVWRLLPVFGLRQSLWLFVGIVVLVIGLRLPQDLSILRQYKYVWLTGSLLLTALTMFLGTNPLGYGPRMWLGCCGVYLQPSEPLKLLFIAYLAGYLADRMPVYILAGFDRKNSPKGLFRPLLPLLAPTLIMIGLALTLLIIQRDLGTASIFFFLYAVIVYVTTGDRRFLVGAALALVIAGLLGYALFDVVRVRVDAWLNPWVDPSGRSYQVIQSLISIAAGGYLGRGPGVGNPGLVPVSHSDLIYAAIVEEHGLLGAIGLLLSLALLAGRGLRAAMHAEHAYHRYLAVGLVAYLVGQSLLIIGGSVRLLPLTGVTLPFVSYGGSSLLVSFVALLILLHISNQAQHETFVFPLPRLIQQMALFLFIGLILAALFTWWWGIYRGPALLARTDNPRRAIADRSVYRGALLDRRNTAINATVGSPGSFTRYSFYPDLGNVAGYTSPKYGQSGLEFNMDGYLRGLEGHPNAVVWWNDLLYGQPPPGLDVRLSLDLEIQRTADQLLAFHKGALVLLDSQSGEILAISSHPTFDPNDLEANWELLIRDPDAPLFNRAAQGIYPPGAILGPFLLAHTDALGEMPPLPHELTYGQEETRQYCAVIPQELIWSHAIASGCPGAVAKLGQAIGAESVFSFYKSLGLFDAPQLRLPVAAPNTPEIGYDAASLALGQGMGVSPLQIALASGTLSAGGIFPAPWLVVAYDHPQGGWMRLPPLEQARQVMLPGSATETAYRLANDDPQIWEAVALISDGPGKSLTWYVAGATQQREQAPLVIALILEAADPALAKEIGSQVLRRALKP